MLGQARQPTRFTVRIGDVALPGATIVQYVASNDIPTRPRSRAATCGRRAGNDVAVLTLTAPVDADPVRVARLDRDLRLVAGPVGRVLGWGEIERGDPSDVLLGGDVVVRADAACPNPGFDPEVMLCAAGTPAEGDENPCPSDSGSPLLVPDGALYALAGVFSGEACATAATPGVFARVGSEPLNTWVHEPHPRGRLRPQPPAARAGAVTLTSTSRHPEGDGYFTTFRWDLDNDGTFGDTVGKSISHPLPPAGRGGRRARGVAARRRPRVVYYAVRRRARPGVRRPGRRYADTPPTPHDPRSPTAARSPPSSSPAARRCATGASHPRPLRRGRAARHRRDRGLPRQPPDRHRPHEGRAAARTKRVRVKLTPQGRRILRRAESRRLRIRVRVRVGRQILRTKRADDPALTQRIERYRSSSQGVTWTR